MKNSFKSMSDNPEWKSIYKIYEENKESIDELSSDFSKKYFFKKEDSLNAFIYEIMTLHYSPSKMNIFFSKSFIKYFFIYISIIFLFLLYLPFLLLFKLFRKKEKIDILYEEMWDSNSWYKRFYKYIDEFLIDEKLSKGILLTYMSIRKITNAKKIELWNGYTLDIRNKNRYFDFEIIYRVLFKDIFYIFSLYQISRKTKINFIYLYLRVLRRLIVYSSHTSDIESKVLICAGDYYWNPLKYLCYKRNIENIILLQHNNKDNYLFGRLFPYCDYYYGHSEDSISRLEGVDFSEKKAVGSFQLIPFMVEDKEVYDILFINQHVYDNLSVGSPLLNQDMLIAQHEILINNLKNILIKNKKLNIVYICKPSYLNREPAKSIKEDFNDFKNITFKEVYGPETFSFVSKSKLVINMYSGVGKEAYGLDKRVLWINYNNCCDIFEFDVRIDEIHTLVNNNSYIAFENKINFLLSDDKSIDKHYKLLKLKYMNNMENPAIIVTNKIKELCL